MLILYGDSFKTRMCLVGKKKKKGGGGRPGMLNAYHYQPSHGLFE